MDKLTQEVIVGELRKIRGFCEEILQHSQLDLSSGEAKKDKDHIQVATKEIELLNQVIDIANAILQDIESNTFYGSPKELLKLMPSVIKRLLDPVGNKRRLIDDIYDCFKKAKKLIEKK